MKKIKIGLPRALFYYRYGLFWKTFFNTLGCKIVLSPETNKEIIRLGQKNSPINSCMAYQIYLGHILYLKDKCDYLLVMDICNYNKKNKVCYKYHNIYCGINKYIAKDQILSINIDHSKYKYHLLELLKLAIKITKNPIRIIKSYIKAYLKSKRQKEIQQNENYNKLLKSSKKVLLVSQFYTLHDSYLMQSIINKLKENNINYIYSDYLSKKDALFFFPYFERKLNYIYSKEMIGALYYYKYQVDAIIVLTDKNCSIDMLVNNALIERNKDILIVNININNIQLNYDLIPDKIINVIKNNQF